MTRIRHDVWLRRARRIVAAAIEIARDAEMRARVARDSSQQRQARAREIIARGQEIAARVRRRRSI